MEFFSQTLQECLPQFKFDKPKGGMFIYGSLQGVDIYELVQECIKAKVVFVPANQFFLDEKKSNAIRFNFTHSIPLEIEEGLNTIARVLTSRKI